MERVTGIEPAFSAWEADVLPLNYTREGVLMLAVHRCGEFLVARAVAGGQSDLYSQAVDVGSVLAELALAFPSRHLQLDADDGPRQLVDVRGRSVVDRPRLGTAGLVVVAQGADMLQQPLVIVVGDEMAVEMDDLIVPCRHCLAVELLRRVHRRRDIGIDPGHEEHRLTRCHGVSVVAARQMPVDANVVAIDGNQEWERGRANLAGCNDEVAEPDRARCLHHGREIAVCKCGGKVHAASVGSGHDRRAANLASVRSVILSDRTLREQIAAGRIIIEPYDEQFVQPSSIDVRISNLFRVFRNYTARVIDVKHDMTSLTEPVEIADDGVFMLHPGEFVLGSTLERIGVPDDLVGRVEGKSSLGRLGLIIHSTAGFIDAGFDGHITLELTNIATLPITLYPGMKIGQVSFMEMTTPAENPYGSGARGSKYQGQRGPTPSRYFENFDR
jgi:dCTP deaminase